MKQRNQDQTVAFGEDEDDLDVNEIERLAGIDKLEISDDDIDYPPADHD